MLLTMIGSYGVVGTARALRNMNIIQRRMLPEVNALDLFSRSPRLTVPVHYVFGEQDALMAEFMFEGLPAAISTPRMTAARLANAGHMAHFDQPAVVRSIVERA